MLHAYSAILMAESASNKENAVTAADNIPLILDFKAVRLIATSTTLETLLSHLHRSIQNVQSGNDETDLPATLILARAIAHIVLADPKRASEAVRRFFATREKGLYPHPIPLELYTLLSCIRTMCRLAIRREMIGGSMVAHVQYRSFNRKTWQDLRPSPSAEELQNNGPDSTAILWLRQCLIAAAYNKWDEETMDDLAKDLMDLFLFEGLRPDSHYLCVGMDALLAILRWYPLWGSRNGHESLDDSTNLQSAWTLPESRPLIPQLVSTLDAFSNHYTTEDPRTFSTFLACQQRLLRHVNTLYETYDALMADRPASTKKAPPSYPSFTSYIATCVTSFFAYYLERLRTSFLAYRRQRFQHAHESYGLSNMLTTDRSVLTPEMSPFRRMHSSCNSNLERLLTIDTTLLSSDGSATVNNNGTTSVLVTSCKSEVVVTVQRLLLTSTAQESVDPTDLAATARLALRIGKIPEKEQLLQGILYQIFFDVLRSQSSDELTAESRCPLLQHSRAIAMVLASTLRLQIWLHPPVVADQAWVTFEPFLRLLVTGDTPTVSRAPTNAPEAWEAVTAIARDNHPVRHSCMGLGVLWLTSRLGSGNQALRQIEEGRLLDWFASSMRNARKEGWVDSVPIELQSDWARVEKTCAGILLLNVWGVTIEDDNAGSTGLQLSNWTSPETIEAFTDWLSDYDGQKTVEIKLDNDIAMQVPIRRDLVRHFVEYLMANSREARELGLRSILEKVPHVDCHPQGDVLNAGQDEAIQKATGDVMDDAEMRGCE
ncbi:hypothetical protein FRB95_013819 [Tulasnella sp. JGI-2019a]|nr:hypothetical protein FRB95_013819 [Tulasnella sp. JGI-2019a]